MERIFVIEPQCRGFEHARFNAAFLAVISYLYPGASIEFISEQNHQEIVRGMLLHERSASRAIKFVPISYRWPASEWLRYIREKQFIRELLVSVFREQPSMVVLSSVSASMIRALRKLLQIMPHQVDILIVPHGILSGMTCLSKRFWNWPIDIRHSLAGPFPSKIRAVALSKPIFNAMTQICSQVNWLLINHPYIFDAPQLSISITPPEIISFAMFGAVRSRFESFCGIASRVRSRWTNVEFSIVGHVKKAKRKQSECTSVKSIIYKPVSYAEYAVRAAKIHYMVWLSDSGQYVASTRILDALNYAKPGIYLRDPLSEEFFQKLGDIGYLCEDIEDVENTIVQIARQFPIVRYRQQVANILSKRTEFSPATVAAATKRFIPS